MVRVEVTLPDWLFNSVAKKKVLALSADYFRLRKPLDCRIYELARKHCGHQKEFKIGLELLRKKTGATSPIRNFKIAIKSLTASNQFPDYAIKFDDQKNMVIFTNRHPKSLLKGLVDGIA